MNRRQFLRYYGIASSAITFSPFFLERLMAGGEWSGNLTRVYKVMNGDCFQNVAKLWEMLDGPGRFVGLDDIVVIKGNAQWPQQGYTHTGCIKAIIDGILQMPGFAGEILICDDVQDYGDAGAFGFDATQENRIHNWPNENWDSLAASYQANGKPVATKRWINGDWRDIAFPCYSAWNPADGEGWSRSFFTYRDRPTYLSYPVFESPLTPGRMIDVKNGVWEDGSYTGRKVKVIFMPTLNNHGWGSEDYAGVTSAIKSFFGATEIHLGQCSNWNGYFHIHNSSFCTDDARAAGELVGRFINTLYAPSLYITSAMWAGWSGRTGSATETKTVLACENPVSLDYISCRDVISPHAAWLNPDIDNNTRRQILGCSSQGIGTLDPRNIEVISYDFDDPSATRLDIERKIRDYKVGTATEMDVKDAIRHYMESGHQ